VRIAYRLSYVLFVLSARLTAWLARDFRDLSRASRRWGSVVVLLVLFWVPARMVSVASFTACQAFADRLG
jgi:hypothetical protein